MFAQCELYWAVTSRHYIRGAPMDTVNEFAPVDAPSEFGEPMTEAWYEDLQGGWGDSIGAVA